MIVMIMMGGIGNQMFQYAFGRFLSLKYNVPLFLNRCIYDNGLSNRTFDLDIFRLGSDVIIGGHIPLAKLVYGKEVIRMEEDDFRYNEPFLHRVDHYLRYQRDVVLMLKGYWQSYRYLLPIDYILRQDFQFMTPPTGRWKELQAQINNTQSVMVNVRRGDYLGKLDFHGVVSKAYVNGAMQQYSNKLPEVSFFVFSDDVRWCKENIMTDSPLFFVDETYYDDRYNFYLQLMCSCRYYILSNSSFCWWSAWLSTYDHKEVTVPVKWFQVPIDTSDLHPPEWTPYDPEITIIA
ncbi:alpha-1,2-fucosyltransferase [Chitinophaga filiformis]|uniref:Glycosyl transferase family 11 n=1 Tax=Chitinophaga filiformis TaxID=104663 RepID=A0A1G7LQH3_CHIFI|nr:alpha-1,2-fucosyltransferase [Chitinophaga filiformis]SDF51651.1 Glycosyl transferase family 11 [Chitinophaga filiformis]